MQDDPKNQERMREWQASGKCTYFSSGTSRETLEQFRFQLLEAHDERATGCFFHEAEKQWYSLMPPYYTPVRLDPALLERTPAKKSASKKRRERELQSMDTTEYCEQLKTDFVKKAGRSEHQVQLAGEVLLTFSMQRFPAKESSMVLRISRDPDCFTFRIDPDRLVSELETLLYVKNRENCPKPTVAGLGTMLLTFVDQMNLCFGIRYCTLVNASFFVQHGRKINADCLYSRTHHGVTYYMSRGFLVGRPGDSLEKCIARTNRAIRRWNMFWNYPGTVLARMRRSWVLPPCKERDRFIDMIKFYDLPAALKQYEPQNPLAPAFFYLESESSARLKEAKREAENLEAQMSYLRLLKESALSGGRIPQGRLEQLLQAAIPGEPSGVIKKWVENDLADLVSFKDQEKSQDTYLSGDEEADVKMPQRAANPRSEMDYVPAQFPSLPQQRLTFFRFEDVAHMFPDACQSHGVVAQLEACGPPRCLDPMDVFTERRDSGSLTREQAFVLRWAKNPGEMNRENLGTLLQSSPRLFLSTYYAQVHAALATCPGRDLTSIWQSRTSQANFGPKVASMRFACLVGPNFRGETMEVNAQCRGVVVNGSDDYFSSDWAELEAFLLKTESTDVQQVQFHYEYPPILDENTAKVHLTPRMFLVDASDIDLQPPEDQNSNLLLTITLSVLG